MAGDGMPPSSAPRSLLIFCTENGMKCSYKGPQSSFPQKANLAYLQTCFECTAKRACGREAKKTPDSGNTTDSRTRKGPSTLPVDGLSTLEWDVCRSLIKTHCGEAFELETFVSMAGDAAANAFAELDSAKTIADAILKEIWCLMNYRFIYKKCKKSSADASNEKEVQKSHLNDDPSKQRA
ncbi:hypothetical protein DFH07DRAFT_785408 [Mycena maculata]|uniref:Uncharacterized protein n=1 Tax=Mycena maculata TaxID=230809 RepID=A0AAD7MHF4_9AGAR|nr:hypothetical protein DFH07DRAFT_785408 [Mycena maculata]